MRTEILDNGVRYSVVQVEPEITLWTKFVRFGKKRTNRAGGLAFQTASREQEASLRKIR